MAEAEVEILLATWNGERYLPRLLESLSGQSGSDFTILARDDGSSDRTVEVLKEWERKHRGRLRLLEDGVRGCGASGNFARLLAASSAPIVLFCDQDDVWKPRKVAVTVAAMKRAQSEHGEDCPLLVHSDLQVVNRDLLQIHSSFWAYQNLRPETGERLNRALVQNVVTGCACGVNQALIKRALPIPKQAIMHDWWLALVAAAFGKVIALPEATIAYRQHGGNDTGAKHWSLQYIISKALRFFDSQELQESLRQGQAQAAAFAQAYGAQLTPEQLRLVRAYAQLSQQGCLRKRLDIFRYGLYKIGLIRNLGLLLRI